MHNIQSSNFANSAKAVSLKPSTAPGAHQRSYNNTKITQLNICEILKELESHQGPYAQNLAGNLAGRVNSLVDKKIDNEELASLRAIIFNPSYLAELLPRMFPRQFANFVNSIRKIKLTPDTTIKKEILGDEVAQIIASIATQKVATFFKYPDDAACSNLINGLAQLGFTKRDLPELNLSNLTAILNQLTRKIPTLPFSALEPQQIANIFNGLGKMEFQKDDLSALDLPALSAAINHNFSKIEARTWSNLSNSLAKMKYIKEELQNLNMAEFIKAINRTLPSSNAIDLANGFGGLAKMHFNKTDLHGINILELEAAVNRNLISSSSKDLSCILNSLANLGFNRTDLANLDLLALNNSINSRLINASAQDITMLFYSLSQLEYHLYDFHDLSIVSLIKALNRTVVDIKSSNHLNNLAKGLHRFGFNHDFFSQLDCEVCVKLESFGMLREKSTTNNINKFEGFYLGWEQDTIEERRLNCSLQ